METGKRIVRGFLQKLWGVVYSERKRAEFAIWSNGHLLICVDDVNLTLTPSEIRSLEKFIATHNGAKKS